MRVSPEVAARIHDAIRTSKYISRNKSSAPTFHESAFFNRKFNENREQKTESAAMRRALGLRLLALKVLEFGLRAYRKELIVAKLDFLLWGWN